MKKVKWLSVLLMSLLFVLWLICSSVAVGEAGKIADTSGSVTPIGEELVDSPTADDMFPFIELEVEEGLIYNGKAQKIANVMIENPDEDTFVVCDGATVVQTEDGWTISAVNAGTYKIDVKSGYEHEETTVTIDKLDVKISVTADDTSLTYGDEITYNATVTGEVEGCDLVYTVVIANENGEECSGIVDAGKYTLKVELGENPNYTATQISSDDVIEVAKRAIELTVKGIERLYGDENPEKFEAAYTEGKEPVGEEQLNFMIASEANAESPVGEYDLVLTLAEDSDVNSNYEVKVNNAQLKIIPRPITVNVVTKHRYYGDANPEFEVEYEDDQAPVNGDNLDFVIATDANIESSEGEYDLVLTLADDSDVNSNYEIKVNDAKLTVLKRPVTLSVVDAERYYYAAVPEDEDFEVLCTPGEELFTSGEDGEEVLALVNGDVLTYTITTEANQESEVGKYDLVLDLGQSDVHDNYDITVENGSLYVVYLPYEEKLKFTTEPGEHSNGWYNELNPAVIAAPEGYTISVDGVEYKETAEYEDAAEGFAYYYLQQEETGARTDKLGEDNALLCYKQDKVAPEISLEGRYDGNVYVKAFDKDSGLFAAELQDGNENLVIELMKYAEEEDDGLHIDYSKTVKIVRVLQLEVIDEAGNKSVSDPCWIFAADSDGDGLNNVFEALEGTQDSQDFDEDGLDDYLEEMSGFSDRTKPDTDGDSISDQEEYHMGLKARHVDSDYDGIGDAQYLRYMNAMGLNKLDLELGMLLLQSNLLQANNQAIVAAGELSLLADEYFQMDNGEEGASSYRIVKSDMGKADQLSRYKPNYYMLRFDARDGKAVYITTSQNGTYYLVQATVNVMNLKVNAAYELPYNKDTGNLAVSTSADGTVVVLAAWANGATTENLLLVNMNTGEQFRFGSEANTVGATRFALSNDGVVLAYVGADKMLYTINMAELDYQDAAYTGNALYFTADGQVETTVDESNVNGVYHIGQPTLQGVSLVLVSNGNLEEIAINGRVYFNSYMLHCRVENLRQSEGIRVNTLYKKLNAAK